MTDIATSCPLKALKCRRPDRPCAQMRTRCTACTALPSRRDLNALLLLCVSALDVSPWLAGLGPPQPLVFPRPTLLSIGPPPLTPESLSMADLFSLSLQTHPPPTIPPSHPPTTQPDHPPTQPASRPAAQQPFSTHKPVPLIALGRSGAGLRSILSLSPSLLTFLSIPPPYSLFFFSDSSPRLRLRHHAARPPTTVKRVGAARPSKSSL